MCLQLSDGSVFTISLFLPRPSGLAPDEHEPEMIHEALIRFTFLTSASSEALIATLYHVLVHPVEFEKTGHERAVGICAESVFENTAP